MTSVFNNRYFMLWNSLDSDYVYKVSDLFESIECIFYFRFFYDLHIFYYFCVVNTFKILSFTSFETFDTLLLIIFTQCAIQHQNSFLTYKDNSVPVDQNTHNSFSLAITIVLSISIKISVPRFYLRRDLSMF